MLNKNLLVNSTAAAISLMLGCANLADARAAKGTGLMREYPASLGKV